MQELGRLEDLPQDYRDELTKLNLVPLWPSLRAVLPPKVPTRKTQPTYWAYDTLRPLLMRAGELTPMEKAERRVLVHGQPRPRPGKDAGQRRDVPGHAAAAARRMGAQPPPHAQRGAHDRRG